MNARTPQRKRAEFERAYGSQERIDWITRQRSIVSGKTPCVNAHVKSGGKGRKADAKWIVPLTFQEHSESHQHGQKTFEAKYKVDLVMAAVATENAWQQELKGGDF